MDVIFVIFVLVVLVLLFMPAHTGNKARAGRINCVNNLKQVGLSFRLWANEHGGFPMNISVTNGGTKEWAANGSALTHFVPISNELGAPKILLCPDDKKRRPATNFISIKDANVSYFVCLNASESLPDMWLAGDRNITDEFGVLRGVPTLTTNSPIGWNAELHNRQGNVALCDGSVQQFSSNKLRESLRYQTNSPLRLAMPR